MNQERLQSGIWTVVRVVVYLGLSALCVVTYFRQSGTIYEQRDLAIELLMSSRHDVERLEVHFLSVQDALSSFAAAPDVIDPDVVRLHYDILWARLEPIRASVIDVTPGFRDRVLDVVDRLELALEESDPTVSSLRAGDRAEAMAVRDLLHPLLDEVQQVALGVNSPEVSRRHLDNLNRIESNLRQNGFWLIAGFGLLTAMMLFELYTSHRRVRMIHRAMLEARKADVAKVTFLANMSHELRTPLNAIIGFSEIMVQKVFGPLSPDTYAAYAADIHNSGRQLLAMVSDVLDLARIEAGVITTEEQPFDIGNEIELALRMVARKASEKNIRLTRESDCASGSRVLRSDPRLLRQTLLNVLNNAIVFTPSNGTVVVSDALSGETYMISVRDSGIGISPENLSKVTTAFFQVAGAETRWHGGAGLGLSIANSFVESLGGKLAIDSVVGSGTTVSLILPATKVEVAPVA